MCLLCVLFRKDMKENTGEISHTSTNDSMSHYNQIEKQQDKENSQQFKKKV